MNIKFLSKIDKNKLIWFKDYLIKGLILVLCVYLVFNPSIAYSIFSWLASKFGYNLIWCVLGVSSVFYIGFFIYSEKRK